ncbi:signal peptidase I [Lichenifustis flavocetrariae]|uniref:Signal peptidase I n=1 Tax=Lichenifustis flavocetrariae TaxID=2949735 RepID=A0AA41Z0T2_9HYPH|nr:signal peptidase I [Lichenifustis flavocetrariae]MCW6510708.1 signal peptidase I [Lichenifustis flavocetrariae]
MADPVRLKGENPSRSAKTTQDGGLWETVKVVVQALVIALVVRTFLFQPFNIPSGSLIPTLLIGDYLFVSKYSYGYSHFSFPFSPDLFSGRILSSSPKRGDVAVFKLPRDGQTDYIKRVIGLPGDKIQLKDARLFINGQEVERQSATPIETKDQFDRDVKVPTYTETLPGGVSHLIIQRDGDTGFYSNTPVYEVPPGEYFMMGDNRDNSTDSRVAPEQGGVGYVPLENFIGRAELIFFSINDDEPAWAFWKWPTSIRWNRLFKPVR